MQGFTETNRRRHMVQQPGTKSGRRPADKPRVNHGFCSCVGLNGISFVRASGARSRTIVHDALGGRRGGCFLGGPTRRRPVLPGPAPPRRPALRRSYLFRPWYVQVSDSTSVPRRHAAVEVRNCSELLPWDNRCIVPPPITTIAVLDTSAWGHMEHIFNTIIFPDRGLMDNNSNVACQLFVSGSSMATSALQSCCV